jgi:type IV secretory pathway VirB2 component (pilin)
MLSLAVILFCPAREVGFTDDSFGIVVVVLDQLAMIVAIVNCVVAGIAMWAVPKLHSAWLVIGLVQLFVVLFCYPVFQSA